MSCTAMIDPPEASASTTTVVLSREVDLASGPELGAAVAAAAGGPGTVVVLDASAVTFIDCAGLGAVLASQARLEAGGRGLRLRAPSPAVTALLTWTQADVLVDVETPEGT